MARQHIFGEITAEPHNQNYKELFNKVFQLSGSVNPLEPVNKFSDLTAVYPDPVVGDSVYVIEDKTIYRWSGKEWQYFSDFTILNDVIDDANSARDDALEAADKANLAANNANTATINANVKINEMNALKDILNTNESTRQSNEQTRQQAENARVQAENTRKQNEIAREALKQDLVQLKQELEEIDVVSLEQQFVAHKNNIENPHNVTASQIGAETPSGAQAKVDELAGKGRTTETVKGNADAINNINTELDRVIYLAGNGESASDYNNIIGYPPYWISYISNKIDVINTLQREGGVNSTSFGFITDIHLDKNNQKHYGKLLTHIVEDCDIKYVFNGGDTYSANTSKKDFLKGMREAFKLFGKIKDRTLFCIGNHDDNPYGGVEWNRLITKKEQYSEYFRYLGNDITRGALGTYYYVDDIFHKIRYIVLDSIDIPYIQVNNSAKYSGQNMWAYRQEQLTWFGNVALDVPNSQWSVVVISHMPPYTTGVVGADAVTRNADLARGILKAFKDKTTFSGSSASGVPSDLQASVSVDFRNKGGNVVCWVAGHVHYDNLVTMPEGIKLVTTINDDPRQYLDAPLKTIGTTTEHAFDIFTINTQTKQVNITRIGAGSDRYFTY